MNYTDKKPNFNSAEPPYKHGKWTARFKPVMNSSPGAKNITFPQFIVEMVVFFRSKLLKDWKHVKRGPDWHKNIGTQVRNLNYQANFILNWFPHPDEEPLVEVAFRNYFKLNRTCAIGGYVKNKKKLSQQEKEVIKGVWSELSRLQSRRSQMCSLSDKEKQYIENLKNNSNIKFRTKSVKPNKMKEYLTNGEEAK